jgi:cobalt/nickel transport system ATP-binding protein
MPALAADPTTAPDPTGAVDVTAVLAADTAADGLVFACRDLHYAYLDRFPALAGVSLDVRAGERVALVGANGCGKSTLLKVLDGLVHPQEGTIHAFGEPITEDALEDEEVNRRFRSRVGFVFQNSDSQVFSPTVREEVAFGCLQLGMSEAETRARVDDVLALLDIADLADRAPFQLSGGQKKRVAIASVLVMNPQVLLFDEPTAALDPRTQHWLVGLIRRLGEAGKTVIVATHDLVVLDEIADRCIVFAEDHTIAGGGPPGEILSNRDLLVSVNLVHEHAHRHWESGAVLEHSHEHPSGGGHHHHDPDGWRGEPPGPPFAGAYARMNRQ